MKDHQSKHNNQVEIHDLIDDAINHALVRRNEALLPLNDEEAKSISGGTTSLLPVVKDVVIKLPQPTPCPPIITYGLIIKTPITIGLVIDPKFQPSVD
jgi:hypothetical protein